MFNLVKRKGKKNHPGDKGYKTKSSFQNTCLEGIDLYPDPGGGYMNLYM